MVLLMGEVRVGELGAIVSILKFQRRWERIFHSASFCWITRVWIPSESCPGVNCHPVRLSLTGYSIESRIPIVTRLGSPDPPIPRMVGLFILRVSHCHGYITIGASQMDGSRLMVRVVPVEIFPARSCALTMTVLASFESGLVACKFQVVTSHERVAW